VRTDPELGWTLRPLVRSLEGGEAWQADLKTNALGFRDEEHGPKAPGVTRVAVLGDSFVFGSGVGQDETLTRRLAALLGPGYDVVNLGVPGYGTDQALLTLRRFGPRLSPDVVLAGFFWNDVMENDSAEIYGMRKPRFLLERGALTLVPAGETRGRPAAERVAAALAARSHLVTLALRALGTVPGGNAPVDREERPVMVDLSLRDLPPGREAELDLTWALLGALSREARALGAAPVLFTIPPRFLADDAVQRKVLGVYGLPADALLKDGFARVKEACAAHGLPVADLLPAFREGARAGEALFLPTGIHWSANGHALAARVLEPAVRDAAKARPRP
jgi:lysophospholipase L1-like esterase